MSCSDEFYHAFCHSGSLVIDCEYCGRVYFGSHGGYDEGEYEGLKAKAEANPEKYVEVDGDTTHWFTFNGKQCVIDCPCKSDVMIENLIWNHRYAITQYLKNRTTKRAKDAAAEMREAKEINL